DIEINDSVGSDGSKFIFTAVDGPPCVDQNQTGCVRIDIQNTITHESGHTLGLDHTTDPNATMYATAPEGETSKRVLGSDDIQSSAVVPRTASTSATQRNTVSRTESCTSCLRCPARVASGAGGKSHSGPLNQTRSLSRPRYSRARLAMSKKWCTCAHIGSNEAS